MSEMSEMSERGKEEGQIPTRSDNVRLRNFMQRWQERHVSSTRPFVWIGHLPQIGIHR